MTLGHYESEETVDESAIVLSEHDTSRPISLGERALSEIDTKINRNNTRLDYEYTSEGSVRLQTSSYVGLVSLSDGTQIEIQPKAAGENLLRHLLYAQKTTPETFDSPVNTEGGPYFLDTIGLLFLEILEELLREGLTKSYKERSVRERFVRGQIDVQRQLSRGQPLPTRFDVEYQELTPDIPENQAVLFATIVLTRLVRDESLQRSLQRCERRMKQTVTPRIVRAHEFDRIHLDRLSRRYEDVLRLAELIVRFAFVETLQTGTRTTFGLLIDMNQVFEAVVERAARDALEGSDLTVESQARIGRLVTGGPPKINMYPDFLLKDSAERVRLVGDAKWKTGNVRQTDVYQMTSYQLTHDVPGVLVYPAQADHIRPTYRIDDRLSLTICELPTDADVDDVDALKSEFVTRLSSEFRALLTE